MKLTLRIERNRSGELPNSSESTWVARDFTIGRGAVDFVVDDDLVSRMHAVISYEDGRFYIADKSTNGTFTCASAVGKKDEWAPLSDTPQRLYDDDLLKIGDHEIRVQLTPHAAADFGGEHREEDELGNEQDVTDSDDALIAAALGGIDRHPLRSPEKSAHTVSSTSNTSEPANVDDAPNAVQFDESGLAETADYTTDDEVTRVSTLSVRPDDERLLEAFLRGAGLDPSLIPEQDPAELMHEVGAALSNVVANVRRLIDARSELKEAFGVGETYGGPKYFNPLNVGENSAEAIRKLFISPPDAHAKDMFDAAFKDLFDHDQASAEGFKRAVFEALEQLSPEHLEQEFSDMPVEVLRTAADRNWKQYRLLHERRLSSVRRSLRHDSLGRAFADGYRSHLTELRAKRVEDERD